MSQEAEKAAASATGIKATRSAAELVAANVLDGYAEMGTAEHKDPKHHLEGYWKRGSAGLRPEGHDYEDEAERLREIEAKQKPSGMVQRAVAAVSGAVAAVVPARFRASRSAAELAYSEAEGYAEPGVAEHKQDPKHHLEGYWKRGSAGLRPEGHDYEDEAERLREIEGKAAPAGLTQRAKEAASAVADKAGAYVQTAKDMLGVGEGPRES